MIRKEFYFLMTSSQIPNNYYENRTLFPEDGDVPAFETLDSIKEDVVSFVEEGRFLLLHGDKGTSKTTWAIKIMKSYFARICIGNRYTQQGIFTYMPSFILKSKDFENRDQMNELIENVATLPFAILDDIAITENSKYDNTIFNYVVNERYSRGLSTIFTSNIHPDRLNRFMDDRAVDRICSDIVIGFNGGSAREYTSSYERRSQ